MGEYKILTINPGSTSTKIAVFKNEELLYEKTLRHSSEEITKYEKIADQFEFRKSVIEEALKEAKIRGFRCHSRQGRTFKTNTRWNL